MVAILDAAGNPLPPTRRGLAGVGRGRVGALNGPANIPYDAADIYGSQMAAWRPFLWSPDGETSQGYRDRIVSRSRDVERNDGWARGGIARVLDNVIGASYRPISKPNYRALAYFSGNRSFDAVWAKEFGHALDACWHTWSDDVGHYCDGMQCLTVSQLFWVALRHALIDGDALGVMLYRPELLGPGRARYATALQLIDPDRLSNPQLRFDTNTMRGGVAVDRHGAPRGYWIRRAHQGDWFSAAQAAKWDYLPRTTEWGRPVVVHYYDHDRASQHHGAIGVLAPVLQRLRMLIKYDSSELEAAIINAIFAAYIKSPYDQQMVQEALQADGTEMMALGAYQDMRGEWHHDHGELAVGGSKMLHLFPGEEIGQVVAARPNSNFEPFEAAVLRHVASGIGLTYEQLTGDFSRTNYSSFRGATNEALKTFNRRAKGFEAGFATPVRAAAVEEFMEYEDLPLPAGAPPFAEFRAAYCRCLWLRPGRGRENPLDEIRADALEVQSGLSTLEIRAAEQGLDWEEIVDQRQIEMSRFAEAGMALPPIYQGPASAPDGGKVGSGDKR